MIHHKRINPTAIQKQVQKLVDDTEGDNWNDVKIVGYQLKFTRSSLDKWTTEFLKYSTNLLLVAQSRAIVANRDCVMPEDIEKAIYDLHHVAP